MWVIFCKTLRVWEILQMASYKPDNVLRVLANAWSHCHCAFFSRPFTPSPASLWIRLCAVGWPKRYTGTSSIWVKGWENWRNISIGATLTWSQFPSPVHVWFQRHGATAWDWTCSHYNVLVGNIRILLLQQDVPKKREWMTYHGHDV